MDRAKADIIDFAPVPHTPTRYAHDSDLVTTAKAVRKVENDGLTLFGLLPPVACLRLLTFLFQNIVIHNFQCCFDRFRIKIIHLVFERMID